MFLTAKKSGVVISSYIVYLAGWPVFNSISMRAQCSVCQELFGDQDVVSAPQCGHTFHNTCITQWLA